MEIRTREIYKDDYADYLLCLALDVGEGMLKNGAEIARVEDTIERICKAYGAAHVECFTIISMITAAIRMPDGSYSSQLRRVRQTENNLNALERFNALSRTVCREMPELDEFDKRIHELKREKPYPAWIQLLASAFGTFVFCLFFGGGIIESLISFVIGFLTAVILNIRSKRLNTMAKTVISAFTAATLAGLSAMLINNLNVDSIIIGVIMLLVPGMLFGTAMRDLLCGDLLAGTLKTLQALLQTLMIGFGYVLAYSIIGDRLITELSLTGNFWVELVMAVLSSMTFAVIFKTNKRHLLNAAVCGLFTFATYYGVEKLTASLFWAAFISSVVAALFSEIMARVCKAPAIVILMPGVISTVPGGYLYRGARNFVSYGMTPALAYLGDAAAIALGIAGGFVTVSILFGMLMDHSMKRKNSIKDN